MQAHLWFITFIFPPLLALLSYILLLGIVLRHGARSRLHRFFALFLLTMAVWSFGSLMMRLNPSRIELWNKVLLAGGTVTMPLVLFGFVQAFLGQRRDRWLWLGLVMAVGLAIATAAGYMIEYVRMTSDGQLEFGFGQALPIYGTYWIFYVSYACWSLIQAYRRTVDPVMRNRIRYPLIGMALVLLGGFTNILPALGAFPIDHAANLINALLLAYTIFRYRLLDISIVVRKGLLYSIPTAIIGAGYFLVVSLAVNLFHVITGYQVLLLSLTMAAVTAVAIQPLRGKVQSWVDRLFFREKYDSSLMLQKLSRTAASVLDLDRLTDMILDEVTTTMHIERAAFFIKQPESREFLLMARRGLDRGADLRLREDHPIVDWLSSHEHALTRHVMEVAPQFKALWAQERKDLESIGAELFVPLKAKGELVGILVLGPKLSEESYSQDDQLILTTLANQTAMAVENARLYEAQRRRRAELEALHQASLHLTSTLELQLVLEAMLDYALKLVSADDAHIFLYDGERLTFGAALWADGRRQEPYAEPRPHGLTYTVARSGKRIVVPDANSHPLFRDWQWGGAIVGLPLRIGERVVGVMNVAFLRPHAFDENELRVLGLLADQAAIAIENARLHEAVRQELAERKRLEEQLLHSQKLEAVGRLAGGVAHDFNNLLTAIIGYSDLVLMSLGQNDPLYKDVEEIKKAAERAASLTRQLLAFSRKQMLQPKVLDLNATVTHMEKMLQRLIRENIELVTILDPALGHIKADPGQIEQVIMNLAVNARDAMPQGGRLTIETANVVLDENYAHQHMEVQPGPYVMLAVSDTGMGMDDETQAHIFEPFFTTKGVGQGTGLGLATVYGIVKQSGGHIRVYSEPGHGTTFKIYLPRIEEVVESDRRAPIPGESPPGRETILLVEDEDMVRDLARRVLLQRGYTVLEARHGREAFQICEQHRGPIHLLVTDVVMPLMNGRELAKRLTTLHPEMKVLYISGYTDNIIIHHGLLEPGMAFLQKPFTPAALAHKVRQALDTSQQGGEDNSPPLAP
ncbi:MAG: GAF domain-containing protein [Anaerolineae bacterium]|nr:GAF domain-containing protein [Anaerolineae bacterium]